MGDGTASSGPSVPQRPPSPRGGGSIVRRVSNEQSGWGDFRVDLVSHPTPMLLRVAQDHRPSPRLVGPPPRLERFAFSPTLPLEGRVKRRRLASASRIKPHPPVFAVRENPKPGSGAAPNSGRAHAGGPSGGRQRRERSGIIISQEPPGLAPRPPAHGVLRLTPLRPSATSRVRRRSDKPTLHGREPDGSLRA